MNPLQNSFVLRSPAESMCCTCNVKIRVWCGASLREAELTHVCNPLDVLVANYAPEALLPEPV